MVILNNNEVRVNFAKRQFFIRLKAGFISIHHNLKKIIISLTALVMMFGIWIFREYIFDMGKMSPIQVVGVYSNLILAYTLFMIGMLLMFSKPVMAFTIQRRLLRAGIVNSLGETPVFISTMNLPGVLFEMKFESIGIPLEIWENRQAELESALNITVAQMSVGEDQRTIYVTAMNGKYDYKKTVYWEPPLSIKHDTVLRLGENKGMPLSVSLAVSPHLLIGGSTGSGKTLLLQLLLMQCVLKDYDVYIIDFKQGVDFSIIWHNKCTFAFDMISVEHMLNDITEELYHRMNILKQGGYRNIDTFNACQCKAHKMQRIVIGCDEVAEMLDMTGLDKDEKEQLKRITRMITTIARLGRAAGIHLILSTQRPDADIIPGQIKNNISYRVCGRADAVLSRIILDNTDAATLIPADAEGFFINHEGIVFKGYFFDDDEMLSQC